MSWLHLKPCRADLVHPLVFGLGVGGELCKTVPVRRRVVSGLEKSLHSNLTVPFRTMQNSPSFCCLFVISLGSNIFSSLPLLPERVDGDHIVEKKIHRRWTSFQASYRFCDRRKSFFGLRQPECSTLGPSADSRISTIITVFCTFTATHLGDNEHNAVSIESVFSNWSSWCRGDL